MGGVGQATYRSNPHICWRSQGLHPIEYTPVGGFRSELKELPIPSDSAMAGKAIVELGLPDEFLIVLVARDKDFVVPSGGTVLQGGDTLLVLSDQGSFDRVLAKSAQTSERPG